MIKRKCKIFSVDFNLIDTNNILVFYKYLMKKNSVKQCLG